MRRSLALVGAAPLVLGLVAILGGSAFAQSNASSIRSDQTNEKAIRALYEQFAVSWNKHDVDALVAMWTVDGDHLEPDGTLAKGRDGIKELLTKQHASVFKNSKLSLNIEDVWFITGDVALVDGSYELSGAVLPDGTALEPRKGHLTAVILNERGKWYITASRLMIPSHLPYKPDTP